MRSKPSPITSQELPQMNLAPSEIIESTTALIESFSTLQADIISWITPDAAIFENVLLPQVHLQNKLECHRGILGIYTWQPGMKAEYDAARQGQKLIHKFETEAGKNVQMYKLISKIKDDISESNPDLESRRYTELTYANFIQNGAGLLDKNHREEFQKIQDELRDLKEAFLQVGIDDLSGIWLSPQDLRGLPNSITEKWERGTDDNEGKVHLVFKRADMSLILSLVQDEEARRKIYIAYENIHQENAPRLSRILTLRDSAARMIGFPNHASMKLEHTMARNPQTVLDFIEKLRAIFTPLMERELESLSSLKTQDQNGFQSPFFLWDYSYYARVRNSKELGFDDEAFSEYFPLGRVVKGVLEIFGELMGMKFHQMRSTEVPAPAIWHPEVGLYSVRDSDQEAKFLGYLYLDLVERAGKSRGESHARINPGFEKADKSRHYPVSAVRSSFPRPTEERPTLLKSAQLQSFIHEIGHAIHNLVSCTKYGRLHGTQVSRDFAEIPSTLFERWATEPSILTRLSFHYTNLSDEYLDAWRYKNKVSEDIIPEPRSQIPQNIIDSLLKSRKPQMQAKMYLNMAFHSLYDLRVHSPRDETTASWNLTHLWNSMRKEALLMNGPEVWGEGYTWGIGQAKFRKLITSYDVGFYSYPLSLVVAADLFQEVFKMDPTNNNAGKHIRKTLLEPGASISEADLLKSCLGRDFRLNPLLPSYD